MRRRFEHNAAAGDFGGVRGEDGRDADAAEEGVDFVGGDVGLTKAAERSAEVASLDGAGRGGGLV